MVNYQNGKIYKITGTNNEGIELIYIGSTSQKLCVRLAGHVRDFKNGENTSSSKKVLICNDYKITLIELYPCNSKEELLMRERYYYDMFDCVNKLKPILLEGERNEYTKQYRIDNADTIKQYYIDNADTICERQKQYNIDNADRIREYKKQYAIENKDRILEIHKQYDIENKDRICENKKQYYIENKDRIREIQKQYYLKKKETTI